MPTQKQTLREAIYQFLLTRGPSTAEAIHTTLLAEGVTTYKTPTGVRNALSASALAFQRPDGTWDLTTRALAGVVLTVRLRSRLRDNVLWVHDDLEPFDGLLEGRRIPLASGGTAELGGGQIRTLLGPEGWLPDVPAGHLMALRWTGGALEVFPVELAPEAADVTDLRELLRRHANGLHTPYGGTLRLTTVLLSVLREAPDAFAQPRLPLSEILPWDSMEISDDSAWRADRDAQPLTLRLPRRVHDELARRAGLLGEHVADHAAVLLGAAVDRVRLTVSDRYDQWQDWQSYQEGPDEASVLPLRLQSS
jgi:hypothetical protein